jgi:hypothetical protein
MKKILSILVVALFMISVFAEHTSPTRLDNMRSLGMGKAYTTAADRISVFFYNPAAIQNVDFSKLSIFNFSFSVSTDWKDIYDAYDDLDSDNLVFDTSTATTRKQTWESIQKTINTLNSLYGDNGSAYFQNFSNWTNNGLGFALFVKAGIDFGVNQTKAGDLLTAAEINAISIGAEIADKGIDPATNPALALAQDGINDTTGLPYFSANDLIPGFELKNYLDYGLIVTKGFTKLLEKKYRDAKENARLDYGVSFKVINRTALIDVNGTTFEGVVASAADIIANEDNDVKYDTVSKSRFGIDLGAMLYTKDSLDTVLGISVIDAFSTDYSSLFKKPEAQLNIGVSMKPFKKIENPLFRNVRLAVDVQDITNGDKDFSEQLKIGMEGRTTSLITWRLGYTDKNLSQGVDFRVGKLGSLTVAHYYDIVYRFGRSFKTENYAISFKAIF